jgi:3-oxoacyl-[acyl-carrier protein] reductase
VADRYASFAHTGPGRALVRRLGLPDPPRLHRYRPGDPLLPGPVRLASAPGGWLGGEITKVLANAGVELCEPAHRTPGERPQLNAALVFDATGIDSVSGLDAVYDFLHPHLPDLYPSGRVLLLGAPPAAGGGPGAAAARRALEGFVRSLAKELVRGATAQLLQVEPGAEGNLESTLRFLLSARSAYVTGQVIRVRPAPTVVPESWDQPLAQKVAVVTGAAAGIGAATGAVLARDGAQVVCVDLVSRVDALATVANETGATALPLDVAAPDAPQQLVAHLEARYGRVDVLVHNAGISRYGLLAELDPAVWRGILDVNLAAAQRLTEAVLAADLLRDGGRVIGLSSVNGIAGGTRGQTGYAASKAGMLGLMEALAAELGPHGITANTVAPGFIQTPMMDRMPRGAREVARRLNTLAQAGQPVDVAETVAWLASPASGGVNGEAVRVCGQHLYGV